MSETSGSISGLTDEEAEFHTFYLQELIDFTAVPLLYSYGPASMVLLTIVENFN